MGFAQKKGDPLNAAPLGIAQLHLSRSMEKGITERSYKIIKS